MFITNFNTFIPRFNFSVPNSSERVRSQACSTLKRPNALSSVKLRNTQKSALRPSFGSCCQIVCAKFKRKRPASVGFPSWRAPAQTQLNALILPSARKRFNPTRYAILISDAKRAKRTDSAQSASASANFSAPLL